jgi:hypothetical protein
VALPLLQQLAVAVSQQGMTHGISGSVPVQLYKISLHILNFADLGGPWFSHPSILVMGLPAGLPIEVLIGMDVLRTCKMVVDGPGLQFTLEF